MRWCSHPGWSPENNQSQSHLFSKQNSFSNLCSQTGSNSICYWVWWIRTTAATRSSPSISSWTSDPLASTVTQQTVTVTPSTGMFPVHLQRGSASPFRRDVSSVAGTMKKTVTYHEYIVCVWYLASSLEELTEIIKLEGEWRCRC